MRKIHFISIILAVALCLAGCNTGIAGQENGLSQKDNVNAYETLAEGQERDWKIEDVLKNDLEIDGIPISLPCTVGELLDTLGKKYSVDESGNLCYNGEKTIISIYKSSGDIMEERIAKGFYSKYFLKDTNLYNSEKGILTFVDINDIPKQSEFGNKYTLPNEIDIDNSNARKQVTSRYNDESGYMRCTFRDYVLSGLEIECRIGGNENE